jgi:23S rRNA pseudouridine955/2504/2580 synthase/23S rRNA pseudouridine1911/1915/1917 synthase
MKLDFLYEDDDLVVVNKPAGLLVIPDRFNSELHSLNKLLEAKLQMHTYVVHRLDRDTSGVICFAKNEVMHKYLSNLFMEHKVQKFYAGLVHGVVVPAEGRIENMIAEHPVIKGKMIVAKKGKIAVTDYKVSQQWPLYALVQVQIHTVRTHQIRVHMQSIGNPIVCDELYGDAKPFYVSQIKKRYNLSDKEEGEKPLLSRLALHAYRLAFEKPDGTLVQVDAPLPKDMAACVNQLNKWSNKPMF